jgi:hypothetical protein
MKEEVRGRIDHLLSFDTTWTKQKTMHPTILCCHGTIFSELLPINDRGIHLTYPLPSNDKEGYKYRHTNRWEEFIEYTTEMGSGAIHIKFHKECFRHSKVNRGGIHRDTDSMEITYVYCHVFE